MLVNLFILLFFVLLSAFAAWVTIRAFRAPKVWVKIAGGLPALLVTLVFLGVVYLGGKGFARIYYPGSFPTPDLAVVATPERVARGEYLVNVSCVNCHGAVAADGRPDGNHPLSGGWDIAAAEGFGFAGTLVVENLTPGGKLATYSDAELFRALRHNVDRDGRRMAFMSYLPYGHLSDDDIQSVIAYLRSLPPTSSPGPTGDKVTFRGLMFFGSDVIPMPVPAPLFVEAPPAGITPEYGAYVAAYGECRGCHGPNATGMEGTMFNEPVPNPRPVVSVWTVEQFIETMRTGVRPNGVPFNEDMPWQNASKMSDEELTALHAYLRAPVE